MYFYLLAVICWLFGAMVLHRTLRDMRRKGACGYCGYPRDCLLARCPECGRASSRNPWGKRLIFAAVAHVVLILGCASFYVGYQGLGAIAARMPSYYLILFAHLDDRTDPCVEDRLKSPSLVVDQRSVRALSHIINNSASIERRRKYVRWVALSPAVRNTDAAVAVLGVELGKVGSATKEDIRYTEDLMSALAKADLNADEAADCLADYLLRNRHQGPGSSVTTAILSLQMLARKTCRAVSSLCTVVSHSANCFDRNQAIIGIGMAACDDDVVANALLTLIEAHIMDDAGVLAAAVLYDRLADRRTEEAVVDYLDGMDLYRLRKNYRHLLRSVENIKEPRICRSAKKMVACLEKVFSR